MRSISDTFCSLCFRLRLKATMAVCGNSHTRLASWPIVRQMTFRIYIAGREYLRSGSRNRDLDLQGFGLRVFQQTNGEQAVFELGGDLVRAHVIRERKR